MLLWQFLYSEMLIVLNPVPGELLPSGWCSMSWTEWRRPLDWWAELDEVRSVELRVDWGAGALWPQPRRDPARWGQCRGLRGSWAGAGLLARGSKELWVRSWAWGRRRVEIVAQRTGPRPRPHRERPGGGGSRPELIPIVISCFDRHERDPAVHVSKSLKTSNSLQALTAELCTPPDTGSSWGSPRCRSRVWSAARQQTPASVYTSEDPPSWREQDGRDWAFQPDLSSHWRPDNTQ